MKATNSARESLVAALALRHAATAAELMADTGAPQSTVAGVLSELVEAGVVERAEAVASGRGRPQQLFRLLLPAPVAAVLLDGTQVAVAVFDRHLRARGVHIDRVKPVSTQRRAVSAVKDLLARCGVNSGTAGSRDTIAGIALQVNAVALPGARIGSSVLPWIRDDIAALFERGLGRPVRRVESSAALVDYRAQSPQRQLLLRLHVGDGISLHGVDRGTILRGQNGLAGELGHVTVERDGPMCGCGRYGCLEAVCAGPALCRRVCRDLQQGVTSRLWAEGFERSSPRAALEELYTAWVAGDAYARSLMDRVLEHLAWALGTAVSLYDPGCVTIGGYVLAGRDAWLSEVQRRVWRYLFRADGRRLVIAPSSATVEDELRMAAAGFAFRTEEQRA